MVQTRPRDTLQPKLRRETQCCGCAYLRQPALGHQLLAHPLLLPSTRQTAEYNKKINETRRTNTGTDERCSPVPTSVFIFPPKLIQVPQELILPVALPAIAKCNNCHKEEYGDGRHGCETHNQPATECSSSGLRLTQVGMTPNSRSSTEPARIATRPTPRPSSGRSGRKSSGTPFRFANASQRS